MISELYVPRPALASFMDDARKALRTSGVDVVYGTIRFIEKDEESFLAWARERYACVIFNLHVRHAPDGLARAADAFRSLIDLAIVRSGSYFLTYHRWARRDQVLACYPQLPELLRRKKAYDPDERFQSDWYRHYATMFA
jgi:FAD/FMN-containing dehydrogenase